MPKITDDQARIEALEARIALLEAKLVEPKPVTPPKPRAVVEEGVRITYPAMHNPAFTMPTDSEIDQLIAIALSALPALKPKPHRFDDGMDEFRRDFCNAFWAVGTLLQRSNECDHGRSIGWWADYVGEQLRVAGRGSTSGPAFVAACLAAGDVRHTIGVRYPFDVGLGLKAYGGGRPATGNAWRNVLEAGRVRAADELPPQYRAVRPQASVRPG
jgi:hypothetical protein